MRLGQLIGKSITITILSRLEIPLFYGVFLRLVGKIFLLTISDRLTDWITDFFNNIHISKEVDFESTVTVASKSVSESFNKLVSQLVTLSELINQLVSLAVSKSANELVT